MAVVGSFPIFGCTWYGLLGSVVLWEGFLFGFCDVSRDTTFAMSLFGSQGNYTGLGITVTTLIY